MVPKSQIESIPEDKKVVFISYSWDSEEHKAWVKKFADDLGREYGIHVLLDQYCRYGENLITYMQDGIELSDRVLIIGTPRYKQRIEQNRGGAKFEEQIISSELYENINTPKYIPIFKEGESVVSAFKGLLRSRIGADFRDDSHYEENLKKVAYDILDKPLNARPNAKEQKAEKVAVKPKVESIEEREHPSLWEKLFQFEQLSNDELKSVVAEACRLIREGETQTSFVEYIAAVINLCAIDELMPLPQDMWESIKKNLLKYIESCHNKEELFEHNAKFEGIYERLKSKTNSNRLHEIIAMYRERYECLYANGKDKMTLFLENMSDETMGELYAIYNGAVPDHTTPYYMTGIFQNVDMEKMYAALCRLGNAAREKLAEFIEHRYSIVYGVVDCGWYMHEEEVEPLRVLKREIDDNIDQFELNDKRAMKRLSDCVGKAIRRCQGDRSYMMER